MLRLVRFTTSRRLVLKSVGVIQPIRPVYRALRQNPPCGMIQSLAPRLISPTFRHVSTDGGSSTASDQKAPSSPTAVITITAKDGVTASKPTLSQAVKSVINAMDFWDGLVLVACMICLDGWLGLMFWLVWVYIWS